MSAEAFDAVDREFIARVDGCVDRMHDASQNIVGSSAAAAVICCDVLGSLWARRTELADDELTSEALLMTTRRRSLEHLEAKGWDAPGDDTSGGVVDHRQRVSAFHDSPAIRYRVALAHAGAVVQGAANTSLVDLHGRHGVGEAVLGDALGATGAAVALRLAQLRDEFGGAVAAFTLWNGGRPSCAVLAASLGHDSFDEGAFDAVDRHRRSCAECAREYRSIVNPAGLFLTSRVARVAPAVRQSMLSFAGGAAAVAGAGWQTTTSAATAVTAADEIATASRPGEDDDIAELWASAAPAVRTSPVPVATPSRRRSRPSTEIILAGGLASLAVVAGGVTLVAGATDGNDRVVIDTPLDSGSIAQTEEDEEVRSMGPVPPTSESTVTTVTTVTSAIADSTTTSTLAPTSTTVPATAPGRSTVTTTSNGPRVASGVPPVPTATTTSLAPTVPVTTAAPVTPTTTATTTDTSVTTTDTTATTEPTTTTDTTATTEPTTTTATTTTTTLG